MAFKVSSDAQLIFFNKVFGPLHPVTEKAKSLLGIGVTFEVTLFAVRAFAGNGPDKGKALGPVTLTVGTTALMKQSADPTVTMQNKTMISDWMDNLYMSQGAPAKPKTSHEPKAAGGATKVVLVGWSAPSKKLPVIKAVMNLTGDPLKTAKAKVDAAEYGESVISTYPLLASAEVAAKILTNAGGYTKLEPTTDGPPVYHAEPGIWASKLPDPVDTVISLKDALALGQKVHGTSHGSVYYTVALTETVKVAARIYKSGAISIRAEWQGQPDAITAELAKLEAAGVQLKTGQGYGSIHFDAGEVPVQRVLGAFLVGTGINWKAAVMNGAELVITEKAQ